MPLSISDPLGHVTGRVIVEVLEYLILLVEEAVEELDPFSLILEEFNDLPVIVEVRAWNEAGEVGRHLKADVHLEVDEIHKEFVDLSDLVVAIEGIDGEGGGRKGSNGGLSLNDDVEGEDMLMCVVVLVHSLV